MQFNDRATSLQDFTADHAALETARSAHRGLGPDRAPQRALRRAQGPGASRRRRAELRRRAIVLLSDGEDTASLVTDDQVLDLAAQDRDQHLRDQPAPARAQDRNAAEVQPGRAPPHRAHPGHRRAGALPQLALRARRGLRPHRRGAAHAVQPRLRLHQPAPRRQVAAHRGARARRARTCRSATSSGTSRSARPRPRASRSGSGRLRAPAPSRRPAAGGGGRGPPSPRAAGGPSPARTSWSRRCWSVSTSVPSR